MIERRLEADTAYILHKRPYRETSLLVDFFSFEHGRSSAVWRAARGAKRRISSEPFHALRISCFGRNELKTLSAVESKGSAAMLTKSLYRAVRQRIAVSSVGPLRHPPGDFYGLPTIAGRAARRAQC